MQKSTTKYKYEYKSEVLSNSSAKKSLKLPHSFRTKKTKINKKKGDNSLEVEIIMDERKNAICSISQKRKWTKEEEKWRKVKGDLGKFYCLTGNSVLFLSQVGLSPIAIKLNSRNKHAAQGLNESHEYA